MIGINHVGLSVRDLDRAIDFYRSTTTLELAGRTPLSGRPSTPGAATDDECNVAIMQGPNAYLELRQHGRADSDDPRPVPVQGPGFTHVCYQSPASFELYSRFTDGGADLVSRGDEPIDLAGAGVRYAYARDGDGIMFEVEQLDRAPFDGSIWIAHVALVSHDLDRLVDFYEQLLGVAPYRRVNKVIGPRADEVTGLDDVRIRAAWFNAGNMVLELWQYVNPVTLQPGPPEPFDSIGYNKFVFEVEDLDAEIERLTGFGVEFLESPTEAGAGQGREVFARDPDGNLFGLQQLADIATTSLRSLKRIDWM